MVAEHVVVAAAEAVEFRDDGVERCNARPARPLGVETVDDVAQVHREINLLLAKVVHGLADAVKGGRSGDGVVRDGARTSDEKLGAWKSPTSRSTDRFRES